MIGLRLRSWSGVTLALTSAVLFGASTPLAKALLGDISPWLLAGLLYLSAALDSSSSIDSGGW